MHPARNTDPATSHHAARFIVSSGKAAAQQTLTAAAVRAHPGHTALEIAEKLRMDRYMLGRRLSECEKAKTVRRGQARTCTISGRQAHTWFPPEVAEQMRLPK
jgi:hypothetical protein